MRNAGHQPAWQHPLASPFCFGQLFTVDDRKRSQFGCMQRVACGRKKQAADGLNCPGCHKNRRQLLTCIVLQAKLSFCQMRFGILILMCFNEKICIEDCGASLMWQKVKRSNQHQSCGTFRLPNTFQCMRVEISGHGLKGLQLLGDSTDKLLLLLSLHRLLRLRKLQYKQYAQ